MVFRCSRVFPPKVECFFHRASTLPARRTRSNPARPSRKHAALPPTPAAHLPIPSPVQIPSIPAAPPTPVLRPAPSPSPSPSPSHARGREAFLSRVNALAVVLHARLGVSRGDVAFVLAPPGVHVRTSPCSTTCSCPSAPSCPQPIRPSLLARSPASSRSLAFRRLRRQGHRRQAPSPAKAVRPPASRARRPSRSTTRPRLSHPPAPRPRPLHRAQTRRGTGGGGAGFISPWLSSGEATPSTPPSRTQVRELTISMATHHFDPSKGVDRLLFVLAWFEDPSWIHLMAVQKNEKARMRRRLVPNLAERLRLFDAASFAPAIAGCLFF
ncbi:gametogenetin-like isoform X1 [Panicum virgatum]|uniref:gametogenetin-like isoform X1 n=1 Tax=Panicum virgatum TaxID=38727 RepID=UPI0019D5C0AE|nr:gametogenetin-like isoform X1 [Panicum virgatum]